MLGTRTLTALVGTAAAAVALLAGPAHADPGPINAGNTYRWGAITHRWEWEDGSLDGRWHTRGHGLLTTRNGMLTLEPGRNDGFSATMVAAGQEYGRWETRARERFYSRGAHDYHLEVELVPGKGSSACNDSVTFADTHGYAHHVRFVDQAGAVRFVDSHPITIRDQHWHTYAVEVTPHRISWYVDAHVVMTERRPAALAHVPFTVRYAMVADHGQRMNDTWMQMDWLRYWTLARHSALSVEAPAATEKPADPSC